MAGAEAFEEFQCVSDVTHTSPKAKIHCVVHDIPEDMKQGTGSSYFDGKLFDNEGSMRVYGYDPTVRRKLFTSQTEENHAILLTGCCVKNARNSTTDLEVFVNKHTTIQKSDKVFALPPTTSCRTVTVDDIYKLPVKTFVNIKVTVCCVEEPEFISSKSLNCQQMSVADSTGSVRLTVWENEINTMEEGKSYHVQNVSIREFMGNKFVSTSIKGSLIEAIPDIGKVIDTQAQEEMSAGPTRTKYIKNVKVVGVQKFDTYTACLKCKGKVMMDDKDEEIGECAKCKTVQCISEGDNLAAMATLILKPESAKPITLRAFDGVLKKIADVRDAPVTLKSLLKARPFAIQYDNGIIQSIRRS